MCRDDEGRRAREGCFSLGAGGGSRASYSGARETMRSQSRFNARLFYPPPPPPPVSSSGPEVMRHQAAVAHAGNLISLTSRTCAHSPLHPICDAPLMVFFIFFSLDACSRDAARRWGNGVWKKGEHFRVA